MLSLDCFSRRIDGLPFHLLSCLLLMVSYPMFENNRQSLKVKTLDLEGNSFSQNNCPLQSGSASHPHSNHSVNMSVKTHRERTGNDLVKCKGDKIPTFRHLLAQMEHQQLPLFWSLSSLFPPSVFRPPHPWGPR